MLFLVRHLCINVFSMAAALIFFAPAHATTSNYKCTIEEGTVFGPQLAFSYNAKSNVILLRDYVGGPYSHDLTLGNVRQTGDMLHFGLEFWTDGFVATRESYSLKFEDMLLEASRDSYDIDGGHTNQGPTAIGICVAADAPAKKAEAPSPDGNASANEWSTTIGKNARGLAYVNMRTELHEFALEFHCDENDWEDNRLGVKFFAISLPRLQARADTTARLSLFFTLPGGAVYRERLDAHYSGGGQGDQAWLGSINAGKSELDALAAAHSLDILNQDGEVAYSFAAKGTPIGVAAIRKHCKLGAE